MSDPFTVEHFRGWAAELVLDNGDPWVLEPFQEAFAGDVFGSVESRRRERTGLKELWLIVPEGNGKSTLMAGLALYHAEFTEDAMVPVAASSRDQAKIIYRQGKGFVRRTPRLEKAFRCYDGYRRITFVERDSQIEIFAADDRTGDGVIPTLALVDELHRHRSMDLYQTWTGKLDKRGAQILVISTAGEPGGEFEETRERFRQTGRIERDGAFCRASGDEWVLHDWAVGEGADVEDMAEVKAANPFSGVTPETLRRKRDSPSMTLQHWRRFVCNLPTREGNAAVQEAEWERAGGAEWVEPGVPIWAGLDVAWKWDTTSLVPLWWKDADERVLGDAVILVPPRNGDSLDAMLVERALIDLHARNPIHTLVMDPSKAEQLAEWVEREIGARVVERQQTATLAAEDYSLFMEALQRGQLRHTSDPGLKRHVLNAVARILPRGDAVFERPVQSRAARMQDTRVIDALVAAAMVHSVAAAEYGEEELVPLVALA